MSCAGTYISTCSGSSGAFAFAFALIGGGPCAFFGCGPSKAMMHGCCFLGGSLCVWCRGNGANAPRLWRASSAVAAWKLGCPLHLASARLWAATNSSAGTALSAGGTVLSASFGRSANCNFGSLATVPRILIIALCLIGGGLANVICCAVREADVHAGNGFRRGGAGALSFGCPIACPTLAGGGEAFRTGCPMACATLAGDFRYRRKEGRMRRNDKKRM